MSSREQWLIIRTQEIIAASDGISVNTAMEMALRERYDDYDKLVQFAASSLTSVARQLKKSTYELPDTPTLFDIPATIFVDDDNGGFFVSSDRAEIGMVRAWARDGERHHAAQRYRFKRLNKRLASVAELEDSLPWTEARAQVATIEAGESNDETD